MGTVCCSGRSLQRTLRRGELCRPLQCDPAGELHCLSKLTGWYHCCVTGSRWREQTLFRVYERRLDTVGQQREGQCSGPDRVQPRTEVLCLRCCCSWHDLKTR